MSDRINKNIIINQNARSPFAEAFRILRTNISFSDLDNPMRAIQITSAGPSEGKTTVASNLAIVLAQSNKKVLLMDCDLRKPMLHKIFDVDGQLGVTNALISDLDPAELAQKTQVPGLFVLVSGPIPPNPSELVGSQRMKNLVDRARESYDCVLLDSPPVNIVTDPVVLATLADGVILLVKSGFTQHEMAREAKAKMEKVGAKIIGVVLNNISLTSGGYYYQYYYTRETDSHS